MLLCQLFLLPVCAYAGDVYHIRPLSESELMTTYKSILLDSCRYANGEWHEWAADSRGGYWGNGISDGNEGIRGVAGMVLTCGALLKYSDTLKGAERQEYFKKATSAIHYVVSTHVTGTQKCVDGKQWGLNWQSAMWTGTFGFGTWLIWNDLDPELRKGVERIVAAEADRLVNIRPPSGRWNDTKAEENAWNLTCLSLAANMFPSHAHAAAWNETAIKYMMNTLSVAKDKQDNTLVDGRPVSEWVCTENLHPDFTLENHGIFHPSYVQCSSYLLTQSAIHYAYAGRSVPQAASHHLLDTWHMFQTILLPHGETTYPQGQDWEQHSLNPINLFASLATYKKDPLAAEMEKINIQYMRAWQEWQNGDLAVLGSRLGFTRHSIQSEQAAWSYIAHKVFGQAQDIQTLPQYAEMPPLVRNYNLVGVLLHRTPSKLLSFSWKYRIMGVLTPIGKGHEGNPCFTVPITNGFVGSTMLGNSTDMKLKVLSHRWKKTSSGFETTGIMETNGGLLKQEIKVTSVGEKTVVYQDRITAMSDVSLTREMGVPIGIENDKVNGGRRVLYSPGGSSTFNWQSPQPVVPITGAWANVDGRLGVVAVSGSGMAYIQADKYTPQGVYADVLCGSFSDKPRSFKAGDQVANRVMVFFAEVTPEETSVLARSIKIEQAPEGKVLCFNLPEGGEGRVPCL